MRRAGPMLVTAVAGLVMILSFFVPHQVVSVPADYLLASAGIVVAWGFVLGGFHLLRVNGAAVLRRETGWPYKLVLVVSLAGTVAVGLVEGPGFLEAGARGRWIFDTLYTPLSTTLFALLAFFMASAAFRVLRVRTASTALMAIAALVVLLGRVPLGEALSAFLPGPARLPALQQWIMEVPQAAARRAVLMGAALGVIATALRVILGLERPHLDGDPEP